MESTKGAGLGVAVGVAVSEVVLEAVGVGVAVSVPVDVVEMEGVAVSKGVDDGVGDSEGVADTKTTPCTYTEVPKAAPALATLSHIKVVKVATVVPQYTLFRERSPKLTPLFTGVGGNKLILPDPPVDRSAIA